MSTLSVLQLFDQLREQPAAQRDAYLRELQQRDPELVTSVQRMFDAEAAQDGLLDRGLGEFLPASPPLAQRDGEIIGPFRLTNCIGRGGMGEVYRAERIDAQYQQAVAIKLLRRGLDSEDILQRFARERRILARLEHPSIARLIDGGMSAGGVPWIAMELVEGEPLNDHATHRQLGLTARIKLLIEVCAAADYAHRHLVVHRDLKPSNVLVGDGGLPRLLDFGIAKLLDDEDDLARTGTGLRVMSPAWAAPEQLRGEPITVATDVHALGLLLYQLLTGGLPQQRGQTSLAALERTTATEPERPSLAAQRSAGASSISGRMLSGDLDTIVLKALALEPARRYASAAALAEDLQRFLDGRPISARADTLGYRVSKFVTRHRGGVLASALVLLALLSALGFSIRQAQIAQAQAIRADAEAVRAESEAKSAKEMEARSKRVKEFLISIFLQEDQLRRDARGPLTMAEAFDDTLKRIDTELVDDPGLQADLLDDFGEIVTAKGDLQKAQELFERALANAERAHGPDDLAVAESLTNLAVLAAYRGRAAEGKPYLQRASRILQSHEASQAVALAQVLMALGLIERNQGQLHESLQLMTRALDLYGGPDGDHPGRLAAMSNVATVLLDLERVSEAEDWIRRVIDATEQAQGPEATPLIIALGTLEGILEHKGISDEVIGLGQRRLALATKAFPADHPWKAKALLDTGWYQSQTSDAVAGEARMREGIAMYQRLNFRSSPLVAAWRRLSLSQLNQNDAGSALESINAATELCVAVENRDSRVCATVRANRARVLAHTDPAQALTEAEAALSHLTETFGTSNNEHAQALVARAAALLALGRSEEAAQDTKAADAIMQRARGVETTRGG